MQSLASPSLRRASPALFHGRCRHFSAPVRNRVSPGSSSSSSSDMAGFIKRMEQTWLISKQPEPVACSSCKACGKVECPWCQGTGLFVLGDNVLCEVSSHNTSCYICAGEGTIHCDQCKGTGYRAKWLHQ